MSHNNSQFCPDCGASMIQENIVAPISDTETICVAEKRCIICGNNQKVAI